MGRLELVDVVRGAGAGGVLPNPAQSMTVARINDDPEAVERMLAAGGAVLVWSSDFSHYLGVLSRDPQTIAAAETAVLIDTGALPALEELLAEPVDDSRTA